MQVTLLFGPWAAGGMHQFFFNSSFTSTANGIADQNTFSIWREENAKET